MGSMKPEPPPAESMSATLRVATPPPPRSRLSKPERFVVTLTDDEFEKLSDRYQYLESTLVCRYGSVKLVIQRGG